MSEGRCWDLGNFSSTRLSGIGVASLVLANARSGFVPEFHRAEKKLSGPLGLYRRARLLLAAHADKQSPLVSEVLYPQLTCRQLKSPA